MPCGLLKRLMSDRALLVLIAIDAFALGVVIYVY